MLVLKSRKNQPYNVSFEEYLQPKKPHKRTALQLVSANEKRQKIKQINKIAPAIQNEVREASRNKWRQLYEQVRSNLHTLPRQVLNEPAQIENGAGKKLSTSPKFSKFTKLSELPNFLAFLRARNDDGLCKRKTGFEIYCEMASFHGFVNFVGATTWQRVFWFLVICLAIIVTIIVLIMSHLMNVDTPTIVYTESTTYSASNIPFPAITICNVNRISRRRAEKVAEKFLPYSTLSQPELLQLFRLTLYSTQQLNATEEDFRLLHNLLIDTNYTLSKLLQHISPNCEKQLLSCRWRGKMTQCSSLFKRVQTSESNCCAFNYHALKASTSVDVKQLAYTKNYGYRSGLSVLLEPEVDDYMAASVQFPGYQVLIHDAYDFPDTATETCYLQATTESTINIEPRRTYATEYLSGLSLHRRRCYFPAERPMHNFRHYTQANCLAECRSELIHRRCGCVPPFWPRPHNWRVCNATESVCVLAGRENFTADLNEQGGLYKSNRYAEQYICNCFPPCEFNQYYSQLDYGKLERGFFRSDQQFFKNVTVKNHIFLHIFYADARAENLRVDVYENWLSYVGTFGGVAGLYMGYSAVSFFEMIFFVLVRPACNWLTMKQIRYRIKRRQKKAAAEAKAKKEQMEKAHKMPNNESNKDNLK